MSCAVPRCVNCKRFRPEDVSFHRFPRNELLITWLNILGKDPKTWIWTKNKVVCSKHFRSEDFIHTSGKRTLKLNAVPFVESSVDGSQPCTRKNESHPTSQIAISGSSIELSKLSSDEKSSIEEDPLRPLKHEISETSGSSIELSKALSNEESVIEEGLARTLKQEISETSGSSILSKSLTSDEESRIEEDPLRPLKQEISKAIKTNNSTSTSSSEMRPTTEFMKNIHSYSISPQKLIMQNAKLRYQQGIYRRRLYTARQQIMGLKQEITSLKTLVKYLKEQNELTDLVLAHLDP